MNNFINRIKVINSHLKDGDFAYGFMGLKKRIYSTDVSFGLVRDLFLPFKIPEAKINISIRLIEDRDAEYFRTTHTEDGLINENIPNCYVTVDDNDVPCFRQWLMKSKENKKIKNYFGDLFPPLKENEALLEGAFIPQEKRGLGIMSAGIYKIIEMLKKDGIRYVITFVNRHNIASLKGCSRAGFIPYILRTEKWFLFNKVVRFTEIPKDVLTQYLIDVVDKPKPLSKRMHLS